MSFHGGLVAPLSAAPLRASAGSSRCSRWPNLAAIGAPSVFLWPLRKLCERRAVGGKGDVAAVGRDVPQRRARCTGTLAALRGPARGRGAVLRAVRAVAEASAPAAGPSLARSSCCTACLGFLSSSCGFRTRSWDTFSAPAGSRWARSRACRSWRRGLWCWCWPRGTTARRWGAPRRRGGVGCS